MGSTLAPIPESLPGTKSALCVASGRSVAAAGGLRAVFGAHDMCRACRPDGWRGTARLSTSGRSSSITGTTTSRTSGETGAAVNVLSTDMPASAKHLDSVEVSMGSADEMTAPLRLPVYSFADDWAGEREGDGNGNGAASSSTGAMDVPADIFAQTLRTDILHRVVRWQLARRQQGTHKTKTRSEVRGGGRKPWQQKGSGRARQGTIRAVQWRGGGTVHGPVVRSHAHDLPKKVRRLGLAVAVSAKLEEGRLVVVDRFAGEGDVGVAADNKTQAMLQRIDGLLARADVQVTRRSVLMVDGAGGMPASVVKSTRNIPWVDVIPVVGLNVYSILQRDVLVMTKDAVEGLITRLHTPIKR